MEKTYNAALIRRVQEYMEKHSISQNQLAAKVNLSSFSKSTMKWLPLPKRSVGCSPGNRMCPLPSARMFTRASVLPSWNTAWWFCTAMQALAKAKVPRSF